MNRRLQTTLTVSVASGLLLAISIPAASARRVSSARVTRRTTTTTTTRPRTTTTRATTTTKATTTTMATTTTAASTTTASSTTASTTSTTGSTTTTTLTGTASGPPPAGGYFATLAPAATLPSGADCAAMVHRSTWEPRPQNTPANNLVRPQPVNMPNDENFNALYQTKYRPRIDGNFTGTTDEIIQWAACKWGVSDDLVRAQAVHESDWDQASTGDNESRSKGNCPPDIATDPCPTSFGLLQSKWYYRPGTYPWTRTSTPFSLDDSLAELRGCLDGMSYAGTKTTGNVWGCIGFWYSGDFGVGDKAYIADVQAKLAQKIWLTWNG